MNPQPIDTAPKDGTPILTEYGIVKWFNNNVSIAEWVYCDVDGCMLFHLGEEPNPKQWTSLPSWAH